MNGLLYSRKINGFDNYLVSDDGRVISLGKRVNGKNNTTRFIKGKILSPGLSGSGYLIVSLTRNNRRYNKLLHRLLAEAFIENPENKPTVNHKNGIRIDNRLENLEWATYSENVLHSFRCLGNKAQSGIDNSRSKSVTQIKDGVIIKIWPSMMDAERSGLGFNNSLISGCCLGKRKLHKGFEWKFNLTNE